MPATTPLGTVIAYLVTHAEKGTRCPACEQHVKVYKRPINTGQARALIKWYNLRGCRWTKVSDVLDNKSREEAKLRYWGLVEEKGRPFRRKNGARTGTWRITELGEQFVLGHVTVPKYVVLYDSDFYGLTGEPVDIKTCLGQNFDYYALMRNAA